MAAEDKAGLDPTPLSCESLLDLEQHREGQKKQLLILQLVAMLCESISDTVFTNVVQVGGRHGGGSDASHWGCCLGLRVSDTAVRKDQGTQLIKLYWFID